MSDIRTLTAASPGPNREQLMNLSRDAGKVKESASQFEALLMGQMLRSARESGGSWFGGGEDEAASSAIGMAEEHLAQTLASQGGLGLAAMVMQGVSKDEERM